MIKAKKFLSLKDYEFSMEVDAQMRAEAFQNYIRQMNQFETKAYWVMSTSGVGVKMRLDGRDEIICCGFLKDDRLS